MLSPKALCLGLASLQSPLSSQCPWCSEGWSCERNRRRPLEQGDCPLPSVWFRQSIETSQGRRPSCSGFHSETTVCIKAALSGELSLYAWHLNERSHCNCVTWHPFCQLQGNSTCVLACVCQASRCLMWEAFLFLWHWFWLRAKVKVTETSHRVWRTQVFVL